MAGRLTQAELMTLVTSRVSRRVLDELIEFISAKDPHLWGAIKPRSFLVSTLLMVLYHDLYAVGFQKIVKRAKLEFRPSDKALIHNAGIIRHLLSKWADSVIQLGGINDWNRSVANVRIPKELEGTCLWIDSTDFPKQRYRGWSKKGVDFSPKLNRPGRRYLVLADGLGKVRAVFGGYSPKIFDGHALLILKRWFEEKLQGAGVIGDQHFDWGGKKLNNVKFFTPFKNPPNSSEEKKMANAFVLTKEQQKFNNKLSRLRARIETPFAWIKKRFATLSNPWAEHEDLMDPVVMFAMAVYTKSKREM